MVFLCGVGILRTQGAPGKPSFFKTPLIQSWPWHTLGEDKAQGIVLAPAYVWVNVQVAAAASVRYEGLSKA